MTAPLLNARMRLSIEFALTAESGDASGRRRQEAGAVRLGMTGAEIDAARRGRSFDVLTSLALALAIAARSAAPDRLREARDRALGAGISADMCREIEAMAASPHTA